MDRSYQRRAMLATYVLGGVSLLLSVGIICGATFVVVHFVVKFW